MHIRELNHVALHVADVDRTVAFYRDVVGLEPIARPAFDFPGAWFRIGVEQELHIIGDRSQDVHSHHRGTHFAMQVESIRDTEAELAGKGVEMYGPKQRPDGAWQIFIKDPDGHAIEFCQLS